jgi:intracellular sulfur oxidation DsrE/DsrF family protein
MPDPIFDDAAPRRTLVRRAAALAFGLAGLLPGLARAQSASEPKEWPGDVKGRHRQLFDAYEVNGGAALAFARAFIAPNPPGSATAVIVLRHGAMPLALNHATWAKYRIGEQFKIIDPETKAPAVKNPFLEPKPGVLLSDPMAIDRLQADGALFAACNVALLGMSRAAAANAGVSAEAAAVEWAANLMPGVALVPSGTWAVNRAQEAGCTYCSGGG